MLIEAVLSVALLALVTLAITTGLVLGQQGASLAADRAQALFLAREGLEVARYMRDNHESLADESDTVGRFSRTRAITTDGARRDIIVTVSWEGVLGARELSLESRLTDWR